MPPGKEPKPKKKLKKNQAAAKTADKNRRKAAAAKKKSAKKKAKKDAEDKKAAAAKKAAATKKAADEKAAADKKAAAKAAAKQRRKKSTDYDDWKFPITNDKKLSTYFKHAAVKIPAPRGRIYIYAFRAGANVLGFWPGTGRWYHAHVYGRHGHGQYKLYFPEDDSVYVGAPECHVKKPGAKQLWAKVDRRKYTDHEFFHTKHEENTPKLLGRYKVGEIRSSSNKYMCKHKETGEEHLFSIGYIQRLLLATLVRESIGDWNL